MSFVKAKAFLKNNRIVELRVDVYYKDGVSIAKIEREQLPSEVLYIDFLYDYFISSAGNKGYFVVPREPEKGVIITYFTDRDDAEYISPYIHMGCYGFCDGKDSILAIITGMRCDCGLVERCISGVYSLYPRFYLDGDPADEDIVVELHMLPNSRYSEMAKCYRDYQLTYGGCVPLKERVDSNPILFESSNSINVRVRNGWKPAPSPVLFQNELNEPDMHVGCTFSKVEEIANLCKKSEINNIEFTLVGWNKSGHDGRYPQIFPVESKLGGESGLVSLNKHLKDLGYGISVHTNSTEAYTIADCWNEEYLVKQKDCSLVTHDIWSGGQPFKVCPKKTLEKFYKDDMQKISNLGVRGLHYIDVITNVALPKCYDANHPSSRKDSANSYRELFRYAKKIFGGVSSEGAFDFAVSDLDYIIYATFELAEKKDLLCDDFIPFFQLVYHGIILYNSATYTLNYPVKDVENRLKFFEYGGRPLAVINANFATRNWMGEEDLLCDNDNDLIESVKSLKIQSDDYKLLEDVRFAFMDKHEKISDYLYRITYSNGITVDVNYQEKSVQISGKEPLYL